LYLRKKQGPFHLLSWTKVVAKRLHEQVFAEKKKNKKKQKQIHIKLVVNFTHHLHVLAKRALANRQLCIQVSSQDFYNNVACFI
jgi:hypothetical protein